VLSELILVRHGESQGNVAATAANEAGTHVISVPARDADVELSPTGREQALALGRLFADYPAPRRAAAVWCSPYARARQTAELAVQTGGWSTGVLIDERLRDRELGILDMLTSAGVEARLPEEAARRRWLGKFYYRPPGGESWADVVLRLRSLLADLERRGGGRVMLVCHDALVLLFRYILEGLTEQEILDIAATSTILNASLTRFVRTDRDAPWILESFNVADHLVSEGVPVTEHAGDANVHPA
jgi:broad specificity phosphatase PhoE